MIVPRTQYIDILENKRGNGLIKVITGLRRCGKSFLLFNLFRQHLIETGITENQIVSLALDDYKNREFLNPERLYDYVIGRVSGNEPHIIFLDEIQLVPDFPHVLNGFLHIDGVDIYVTGSNSKFLSSDVVTEFRGRGDEVRVWPFSFSEVYSVIGGDKSEAWSQYVRYGGMPLALLARTSSEKEKYLKGLFGKVYLSDIVNRYGIRRAEGLDEVTNCIASSIGTLTNPKRISDTFHSTNGANVSPLTVGRFLDYLEDSFLVSKAMRYDVKGRRYIGTPMKYYFTDVGLRNARLNFRQQEESHIMENIIYNELLLRGFSVDIGTVEISVKDNSGRIVRKQLEVDFIASAGSRKYYIQSAMTLPSEEKQRQEKSSLLHIHDSFKKIIIQKDPLIPWHDEDGILHLSVTDFLLNDNSLDF